MRPLLFLMLAPALILCAGCLKMHMDTVMEKDGSGTCTISTGTSREVFEALSKMEAASGGKGFDAFPMLPREMSRSHMEAVCRQAGVELLDHRIQEDADHVGWTMTVRFDDIGRLSAFQNAMSGSAGDAEIERLGILEAGDGDYVLTVVTVPGMSPDPGDDDDDDDLDDDMLDDLYDMGGIQHAMESVGTLMSRIGELDVRLSITVPGDVIHSNAMEVEGRTSIWTLNAANMMHFETADIQPEIRFSGKGLDLKTATP